MTSAVKVVIAILTIIDYTIVRIKLISRFVLIYRTKLIFSNSIMRKIYVQLIILFGLMSLGGCAGIKHFAIETYEPAQVSMPVSINSLLVVNNVVEQPEHIGHEEKRLGQSGYTKINISSDSVAIYYTEALAQFLEEEEYYDDVKYNKDPLRKDKSFFTELPILPDQMFALTQETGSQVIVSLDKMILQTRWNDYYEMDGYRYARLVAEIQSVIRIYMPSLDGKIPAIQFADSLVWEGYEIRDNLAYADLIIPTQEEAMKELAVYAAEKMTRVFAPHWDYQERWYYTSIGSKMREGEIYARNNQWDEALVKWSDYYDRERRKQNRARIAHNIAVSYEMLNELEESQKWADKAHQLFEESTSINSLERRRSLVYKKEIERRVSLEEKLQEQLGGEIY